MNRETQAWLESRPQCIRDAYAKRPADKLWRITLPEGDGRIQIASIKSYTEPAEGELESTVRVLAITINRPLIPMLNPVEVFGVSLDALMEATPEEDAEFKRLLDTISA